MAPLLDVDGLTTGYGRVEVLHGVTVQVPEGSVVAVLGANGAGKTTLLSAIAGVLPAWEGRIRLDGRRLDGRTPYQVARRGVVTIPEGRGVFPGLTVEENLEIAVRAARDVDADWRAGRMEELFEMFPRLQERKEQQAGTLSGGEQQMLALSRAFLAKPRVLLIDELSTGLAPLIVEELFARVGQLKERGLTIVLVEQYLTYALQLADICYVLSKGEVTFVGEPAEAEESGVLAGAYLGAH
ncbi:MAG TPA: ABC transporter ATP-binding protein [Acidimicrobiia bacterium]|nr:ABC transporter ATP-binding protein [Acidimicrobiia bacterium]